MANRVTDSNRGNGVSRAQTHVICKRKVSGIVRCQATASILLVGREAGWTLRDASTVGECC
jgi:hypothetical protein